MITKETLKDLAREHQTSEFPNVVREYFQHLFLSELYKLPGSEKLLFKGGTALRIIYSSPRFSEDLDFSLFGVRAGDVGRFVEKLFTDTLAKVELHGAVVELAEANLTSGGYFGLADFKFYDYPPVSIEINVSSRKSSGGRKIVPEPDSIATDFVPTYTLLHLPQEKLIEEKIFGALLGRKQPRDFYDLYFIMRKGMLSLNQKKRLASRADEVISASENVNFKAELEALLPADQHRIVKDFGAVLAAEFERQVGRGR